MSDYSNPFENKPIEKVKNDVREINRNLNKIKTDLIAIKADISIIRDFIKLQEKSQSDTAIEKGWFW